MKSSILLTILGALLFNLILGLGFDFGSRFSEPYYCYAQDKRAITRRERREQRRALATSSESETKTIPKHMLKEEQKVDNKSFDDDLALASGLDTLLILDSSGSMRRTDPNRLRDQGAKLFVRFLGEGDRVAIIQFDREAKKVLDFTEISAAKIPNIDTAIDTVGVSGTHTDIEAPIRAALDFLKNNARKDVVKSIVLLSDGKMDPHPESGTAEELTKKLFDEHIKLLKRVGVKVYTLSFSAEADQELLRKMAEQSNAIHWFAPDVNTIHKKFSEMFLALKNPQVLLPEGSGYEVDASANEITFYISRTSKEQNISIINPLGAEITNRDIPAGVKWFKGELFDIITIGSPMPGFWGIEGVEPSDGFATLLSDIKLQVRWPSSPLMVGDSVRLVARLTEEGKPLDREELKDLVFYNYQVINKTNGERVLKGSLLDDKTEGDEEADDGLYSAVIKLELEGEYQLVVNATAPTFTRHQVLPLSVSKGLVLLSAEKRLIEDKEETFFVVKLSPSALELNKAKLMLLAKKVGSDELLELPLPALAKTKDTYEISATSLPVGGYAIEARLSGVDSQGQTIRAASETIHHLTEEVLGEVTTAPETKEVEAPTSDAPKISSIVITLLWATGLILFIRKKYPIEAKANEEPNAFSLPPHFLSKLETIKSNLSEQRRTPTNDELELFAILGNEAFGEIESIPKRNNHASTEATHEESTESALEEINPPSPEAEDATSSSPEIANTEEPSENAIPDLAASETTEQSEQTSEQASSQEEPAPSTEDSETVDKDIAASEAKESKELP